MRAANCSPTMLISLKQPPRRLDCFLASRCRFPGTLFRAILSVVTLTLFMALPGRAADLQEDTAKAYEQYVAAAEARMERERSAPGKFLHIENLPEAAQKRIWASLRRGEIWTSTLDALDGAGHEIHAPHGTITHWVGDVFFPGSTIDQILGIIRDYDHLQEIYKPEIVRSKLLARDGETFQVYMRLHKDTPWVNPTFDVNSTVTCTRFDSTHVACRMVSTRVVQVEDAGKPTEHEDSVGHDGGYLWRLSTYWRLEARDGGVVGEWEAITLSRDIPFLLRWLVRPYVERLARQTVQATLMVTRNEVERRRKPSHLSQ